MFGIRYDRRALLGGCAAGAMLLSLDAAAQQAAQQADGDDEGVIEEVVVTGSRIRRSPLDAPQPLLTLSESDIDKSGLTNVGDFLQQLPQSGGTFNRQFNNSGNFGFPPDGGGVGAGSIQADLRNLGPKRVLVLVDGQRWVNETSASGVSSSVDLGTVPLNAIERIEVLQDGASAIYGSDAIGGVINIHTKRDLDGFDVSAFGGLFLNEGDGSDGETQKYSLSYGAQGERTRIFFDVSYTREQGVDAPARGISEFPTPGVGECTPFCSSGTPQGRFIFGIPGSDTVADLTLRDGAVNAQGNLAAFDPDNPGSLDFKNFEVADRFNFAQFNLLLTPNKRISFFTNIEHDLADNVRFDFKAVFNNRESTNRAAPEPLFIGPEAGTGSLTDTISVHESNPFNPFGFTLNAEGDDPNLVFAGRRPIEAGPRIFKQNVDTWYLNGGLNGDFELEGRRFFWDIHVIWSESQANQRKFGAFNAARLKTALGPIDECVVNDENGDGVDDLTGCTPFNFFGGQGPDGAGSITDEMLDFVGFIQKDESESTLFDVNFNVTGDLIELPAGWLSVAAGYEHRERDGFFQPDAVVVAGESAGVPSQPVDGQFDVDEVYGELSIPLLADLPGFTRLEASFAARHTNHSITSNDTIFKAGVNWRVTEDLLFRGSFSEGFRAPGIGEFFNPGARFDVTLQDPCSDILGLESGNRKSDQIIENCVALRVPADGSFVQFNQQISATVGGNPDLEPEESDNWNVSAVYSPRWAEAIPGVADITLETVYWNIDIDGAIQPIDQDFKLQGCVETLDEDLCDGIGRSPGGAINELDLQLQNIGGIETDGVDITFDYNSPGTIAGQFHVGVKATWVNSFEESFPTADGFRTVERVGTEQGDPEKGWPEWQFRTDFDWVYEDFAINLTLRYIDDLVETCPASLFGVSAGEFDDLSNLCSNPEEGINKLDDKIYGDLQVTWSPGILDKRLDFTIGVNNLFDTDPPECFSCALNGFDATLYSTPNRFGFIRLQARL